MKFTALRIGATLTAMALCSSVLFLIGYWGSFQLNIFEFVSFDDVIRSSIAPLISLFGIVAALVAVYSVILIPVDADGVPSVLVEENVPKRHRRNIERRASVWFKVAILAFVATPYIFLIANFRGIFDFAYAFALFISMAFSYACVDAPIAEKLISEKFLRWIAMSCVIAVPAMSMAHGVAKANSIRFAYGDFYVRLPNRFKGSIESSRRLRICEQER